MAYSWSTPVTFDLEVVNCRLDKFYLLARRYVAAGFKFLHSKDWSEDVIEQYNEMLETGPLRYDVQPPCWHRSPTNPKIPNSIRYHITDIYLDELEKVIPLQEAPENFLLQVRRPFIKLQTEGIDKTARIKARELLEDPRLNTKD